MTYLHPYLATVQRTSLSFMTADIEILQIYLATMQCTRLGSAPADNDIIKTYTGKRDQLDTTHGSTTVTVVPSPSRDHSRTLPPAASVSCFTIASPSPEPPVLRDLAGSTR